jgi:hypothetical protein
VPLSRWMRAVISCSSTTWNACSIVVMSFHAD